MLSTSLFSRFEKSIWKKIQSQPIKNHKEFDGFYKGVSYEKYIILFPTPQSFETSQKFCVLDLEKLEWKAVPFQTHIPLLKESKSYSITVNGDDIIIFGSFLNVDTHSAETYLVKIKIQKTENEELEFKAKEMIKQDTDRYREFHSADAENNHLWIYGGRDGLENSEDLLMVYNLACYAWVPIKFNSERNPGHVKEHSSFIDHGKLFICGGKSDSQSTFPDIWTTALDVNNIIWKQINIEGGYVSNKNFTAAIKVENQIIILGSSAGMFKNSIVSSYEEIDEKTWKFVDKKESLPIMVTNTFVSYKNKIVAGIDFNLYEMNLFLSDSEKPSLFGELSIKPRKIESTNPMRRFFEERPYPDITFKVQGQDIGAHKGFIIIKCSYFNKMFSSGMMEAQSNVIEIPDMKPEVFTTLLEWIYCDSVQNLKEDVALELYKAADKFVVPGLKTVCEDYLIKHLRTENVIERAILANMVDSEKLIDATIDFIIVNIDEIFEKDDIRKLPNQILRAICKDKKDKKDNKVKSSDNKKELMSF